jgi:hypothetical protein
VFVVYFLPFTIPHFLKFNHYNPGGMPTGPNENADLSLPIKAETIIFTEKGPATPVAAEHTSNYILKYCLAAFENRRATCMRYSRAVSGDVVHRPSHTKPVLLIIKR